MCSNCIGNEENDIMATYGKVKRGLTSTDERDFIFCLTFVICNLQQILQHVPK